MSTYVHEGTEVKKTGREATRVVKTLPGQGGRVMILVEITPVEDADWKKWVSPDQLYEVRNRNENS
jgi:hypothetical protein